MSLVMLLAAQVISSFFIPLEALFPDKCSRSIQTQTVPCDMPTIVLLAPEEQHQEKEQMYNLMLSPLLHQQDL